MERWIYAYRLVGGQPDELERMMLGRCRELLQLATAAPDVPPAADGSFLIDVETHVAGLDLGKRVRVETGVAHRSGRRVILPLSWRAEPARRAFPVLEGQLELETMGRAVAQLTLVGSYRVPFGPIGAAVDATVLHDVAQRTADRLVEAVSRELARAVTAPVPDAPHGPRVGGALEVRDVMTADPLVLDPDMPLRTAALLLFHAEVSGAPVVADDGALVGVLSERDLLVKEADLREGFGGREEQRRRAAVTVGEACTRPARTTVPEARLAAATRNMLDHDVSRLVVVGEGRVVGIVTRHDVLAALVRSDADILGAVRAAVPAEEVPDLHVFVEWGTVTIAGTVRLRSHAVRIHERLDAVEGVMTVDDDGLTWEIDDLVPTTVPLV